MPIDHSTRLPLSTWDRETLRAVTVAYRRVHRHSRLMRAPSRFFWLWLGFTILCESIALRRGTWPDPVRLRLLAPIIALLLAGIVDSLTTLR